MMSCILLRGRYHVCYYSCLSDSQGLSLFGLLFSGACNVSAD